MFYKKKSFLVFLLYLSLFLIGCQKDSALPRNSVEPDQETAENTKASNSIPTENTISLLIEGYESTILVATSVEIQEKDTILDATTRKLQEEGIHYSIKGSGPFAYVEGINNLYEFDHGPLSGWLVTINGEHIKQSAGTEPIAAGDQIEWYYTTENTEVE